MLWPCFSDFFCIKIWKICYCVYICRKSNRYQVLVNISLFSALRFLLFEMRLSLINCNIFSLGTCLREDQTLDSGMVIFVFLFLYNSYFWISLSSLFFLLFHFVLLILFFFTSFPLFSHILQLSSLLFNFSLFKIFFSSSSVLLKIFNLSLLHIFISIIKTISDENLF